MKTIDINCDLGEGGGQDEQIMPLISSCNIACGGHYGTPQTMSNAVRMALKNNIAIGAHPSYPDRKNFGREKMALSSSALRSALTAQLTTFSEIMKKQNVSLHHVKVHGALYHDTNQQEEFAKILIEVVKRLNPDLILYVPPQSIVCELAKGKLKVWKEGFADRQYRPDYELVSRKEKGAVISRKEKILEQVLSMVIDHKIPVENGMLEGFFQTICLHSDTPGCLDILKYLYHHLPLNGIQLAKK